MKKDIHPNYSAVSATCTCGNTLTLNSTLGNDLHIDVCSNCHPFYTGQQKMVDTGGRVDRFKARQAAADKKREALTNKAKKTTAKKPAVKKVTTTKKDSEK